MAKQEITFTLKGPPVAWHRAKLSRSNRIDGRGIRVIKHPDDRRYQQALAIEAAAAIMRWRHVNNSPWDATGEWSLEMDFHVHDLKKRDVDNLSKQVLDALSTIAYDDDRQVTHTIITKRLNRSDPKTTVTLRRVEGYLIED